MRGPSLIVVLATATTAAGATTKSPPVRQDSFAVAFTRTLTTAAAKPESAAGEGYCHANGKCVVRIDVPVLQCITAEANQLVIYYPNEKKGIILESKAPPEMPVMSSVFFWLHIDEVLASGQFQRVPDPAVERWRAANAPADTAPEITIARDDKKRATAIRSWGGATPTQASMYADFASVTGLGEMPMSIKVVRTTTAGSTDLEEIGLERAAVGADKPAAFDACTPDPGAKFTRRKW